jgi:hypothetical protein
VGLRRPHGGRLDGAAVTTIVCAVLVAAPLIGLPISFVAARGALDEFSGFLPEAVTATFWILIGVGGGTLLLGTAFAALVSFFEFPGRRWIEWALVLPLAMPGYVFTLFALGLDVPGVRSTGEVDECGEDELVAELVLRAADGHHRPGGDDAIWPGCRRQRCHPLARRTARHAR